MAWVVDTCLLIDVAEADPSFHAASAALIDAERPDGLRISPITFIELSPVFAGNAVAQIEFLRNLGIPWPEHWTFQNTISAHAVWANYVARKKVGASQKRPITDILIGAFAQSYDGLLTRIAADFASNFPSLQIVEPTSAQPTGAS